MILIGKIAGGVLGYNAALWLGGDRTSFVVAGVLLGQVCDAVLTTKFERWRADKYWKQRVAVETNKVFFQSLFGMLGKLVVADGPTVPPEKEYVDKLINETLKMPRRSRREAQQCFRYGQVSATSFQYEAIRFYEAFKTQPQMLENAIAMFFSLAVSDGRLKISEENLIRSAAMLFNYPEASYVLLRRRFTSGEMGSDASGHDSYGGGSGGSRANGRAYTNGGGSGRSYEILGCSPADPEKVIKQRYRKLVADFHPDKIVSKDLPDEFLKFANEKFKSIQEAYESIKAERGFN